MSGWATITVLVEEGYEEQTKKQIENRLDKIADKENRHWLKTKDRKIFGHHKVYGFDESEALKLAKKHVVKKVFCGSFNDTGDSGSGFVITYHDYYNGDFGRNVKQTVLDMHGFNPYTRLEQTGEYDSYPEWPMFQDERYGDYEVLEEDES